VSQAKAGHQQAVRDWIAAAVADGWTRTATYKYESIDRACHLEREGFVASALTRDPQFDEWRAEYSICLWGPDGAGIEIPYPYYWQKIQDGLTTCPQCHATGVKTVRVAFADRACEACAPALTAKISMAHWQAEQDRTVQIIKLYSDGLSTRNIGMIVGLSNAAVHLRLLAGGCKMRSPGRKRKLPSRFEVVRLYCEEKWSTVEIASMFGTEPRCVGRQLAMAGITLRQTGGSLKCKVPGCKEPPVKVWSASAKAWGGRLCERHRREHYNALNRGYHRRTIPPERYRPETIGRRNIQINKEDRKWLSEAIQEVQRVREYLGTSRKPRQVSQSPKTAFKQEGTSPAL
jgi:transposase-like protein